MKVSVASTDPFKQPTPALVIFVFQNERFTAPASLKAILRRLHAKEFDASENQLLLLHTAGKAGVRPARVLLAGLGRVTDFNSEKLRRATGLALKKLRDAGIESAVARLNPETPEAAAAVAEAAVLALYKFTEFNPPADSTALRSLTICISPKADQG